MNKINTFFKKHKTKVIVYSSIFIVVLIISNILLNSAYSFVVSEYEKDPTCIQTCEDGINTLRKMKYYRNSKNYILRMKRSNVRTCMTKSKVGETIMRRSNVCTTWKPWKVGQNE